MRTILIYVTLFTAAFSSASAQSKCDPTCKLATGGPVLQTDLDKYKTNYESVYRVGTTPKKTHSVSVDFSKEAINLFYSSNFVGTTLNEGFNVYFICLNISGLPGHRHNDQIGLGIFPADASCKSDFSGTGIFNNSYNQRKGVYSPTKFANKLTKPDWEKYQDHYKKSYSLANPDNYTNRVHFGKDVLDALFVFINSDAKYTGVRFELGVYNLPDMACGQKSNTQLTLFISPVLSNGATDYDAFLNFFKFSYANGSKFHMLDTYNHGELCPKICPE